MCAPPLLFREGINGQDQTAKTAGTAGNCRKLSEAARNRRKPVARNCRKLVAGNCREPPETAGSSWQLPGTAGNCREPPETAGSSWEPPETAGNGLGHLVLAIYPAPIVNRSLLGNANEWVVPLWGRMRSSTLVRVSMLRGRGRPRSFAYGECE